MFSENLLKKAYVFLTQGNATINFYCTCLLNREKESLVQRPLVYGWKVLKINLACRLGGRPNRRQRIGKAYLGGLLRRTPISEFAKRMLQSNVLIVDLGSLFVGVADERGFFRKAESLASPTGQEEALAAFQAAFPVNPFMERLLDIAACNGMTRRVIASLPYPKEWQTLLAERLGLRQEELLFPGEKGQEEALQEQTEDYTLVVSGDYRLIRAAKKQKKKATYYEDPLCVMQRITHPPLAEAFRSAYDKLCGIALFSGEVERPHTYELAYLCMGPAVCGLMQQAQAAQADRILCLTGEEHPFLQIYRALFGDADGAEWSALAGGAAVEDSGIPAFLRKKVLESGKGGSLLSEQAARRYVKGKVSAGGKRVLVLDPFPGSQGAMRFCSIGKEECPDVELSAITMSGFLRMEELDSLAGIMAERSHFLCHIGQDGDMETVYPIQMAREMLAQVWNAIEDFSAAWQQAGDVPISGEDARRLYEQGAEAAAMLLGGKEEP